MTEELNRERLQQHADIAKRLQDKLLKAYELLLDSGEMTAADRKNLQDLLVRNGWTFDPASLPDELKNKLTKLVKFDEDLDNDNRLRVMP
jgi:hypothetical protein